MNKTQRARLDALPTALDLNLDAMPADALIEFAMAVGGGSATRTWGSAARKLFPSRPAGYVVAANDLRNYAWNKAVAMRCRADGHIPNATTYEIICDTIYDRLPDWAKGW